MKRTALALFVLVGCAPPNPYANYPAPAPATNNDPMLAACQQQANQELQVCTSIAATGKYTNSGWELRAHYDRIAKTCPAHAHDGIQGQLESCVTKLEAFELQQDPDAPARRQAAKPHVDDTRGKPEFKQMIDAWMQALDGKNITCRNKDVSASDARECDRWHGEMEKIEDRLTQYLVAEGYDKRDFRPLGLWPQDPDWRTSPN